MVKIHTRKTSTVKPAEETPQRTMALTLMDRVRRFPLYNSVVHLYRQSGGTSTADALRESLSKTLIHFYPIAGRYRLDRHGSVVEIDCNGEGVLFIEAETDSALEDLGDFAPSPEISKLIPSIDHTQDISSFPIMAAQVTFFKCGGVSLGICTEHHAIDGSSGFLAIKSWSEIARGLDISIPPFLERTLVLRPRDPPQPKFDHPENSISGCSRLSNTGGCDDDLEVSVFRLSRNQLYEMKAMAKADKNYSTFEVLAGHVWKCVCKSRRVGAEEETRMIFPVNGRAFGRWKPELPPGFVGNAVFRAVQVARAGDLESKPLWYAAGKIHEASVRMDDEYLRSGIDHLALMTDLSPAKLLPQTGPNFQLVSYAKMGLNDADFGWGPPIYTGPGEVSSEKAIIFSSDQDNGGLTVAIALQTQAMEIFGNIFYNFV